MAKMHWCACRLNLSGQGFTVHEFHQYDPVSWPEVQVLMLLHGDENVYDIKPVRIAEVDPAEEKRRLLGKYGAATEAVFPGRTFRMEMCMPGEEKSQPPADSFGQQATVNTEGESEGPLEPPTTPPVFKPGKHNRPAAEA